MSMAVREALPAFSTKLAGLVTLREQQPGQDGSALPAR
jgi:hypothetical protein